MGHFTSNGILFLDHTGRPIKFDSDSIKISDGSFRPVLPHDVRVPGVAEFNGETGPYNFTGDVGFNGVHLHFTGPGGTTWQGTINGPPPQPPIEPIHIAGAANVELK